MRQASLIWLTLVAISACGGKQVDIAGAPSLEPYEEDWCNRLEGRAGGWLVADESGLVVDVVSGEPFSLDPASRGLLVTIAVEGAGGVTPDDLAQLDTFLRLPVPSALACRAAYEAQDK